MCGIAGWADFTRDLRQEVTVAEAMTRTMALRGPDAGDVWVTEHAALGHRRLSIIDLEGGRQPMVAEENGKVLATLVYSGEVYNFRELREELAALGHTFRTRSDTEVVLRAYLQWGEFCAERLNGMFAFAVWDNRSEELVLVRDRVGIKPLYYQPLAGGVLFGSEPKAILANPLASRTVDADGVRELIAGVKAPGAGVIRNMPELAPGHVLTVGRFGSRLRRYWKLEAREHEDDLPTTIRTVRELLEDIVARQLVSDVPLATMLSGGLDSSTLTALAARANQKEGKGRVRSFSVDFIGYEDNFEPDITRQVLDAPYVKAAAEHIGSDHTDIVLTNNDMIEPSVRSAVIRAMDWPILVAGSGSMDISLFLLFRAIREQCTVALTGESADELFGGYPWFHHPEFTYPGTLPWSLAQNMGLSTLFGPVSARLGIHDYQRDHFRQAVAEVPRIPGESGKEKQFREYTYFFLTRFMRTLLDRKDRLSMAQGLEVRVPFCDHRLQEYVYNVPYKFKYFDGQWKSLLRAAAADLLPESVLKRPKSGYPISNDQAYDAYVQERFAKVVADDDARIMPLLNPTAVADIRRDPASAGRLTRTELDMTLHVNEWLTTYDLTLDV
ncbi:asparagine synthase (glutamine-hydrolyzing) [Streptomyces sp. Da 82-17]|uniref:asparagine synthase (glutamine-hydrolyzing) n=1 Tax=Streptomyces sp. Da 82-17 TaxID=3377116 RepID=UPI0038D4BED8